ncbi:ribosome small subunit-dependent GTPase A [Jiangella anatolica]|uniref:Small ribosomal subunit biogenesis GTPase RsgA n=1 Tax=Jiangella anatolica TaxID=2670374 RepID=A0A2W2B1E5_9ACTN|nr:ribosome small subunit-dependent GTPase A [Jiangella anatolica]PZF81261.1 ribosome small subunit-dependent GTPase A [Jiangella anatolica]
MARRTAASSYDERDVRVRPGRGSRPRSKLRPAHADATPALVIAVDRGRYTCVLDGRTVTAMTARELGRKAVVVGDRVGLVGDVSGAPGTLARIVRVEERTTVLRRTADDDDPVERVIVANADQLMIVTAVADPEPRPRLIDRALVAAFDAGIEPLLCLTKADLADPAALLASYAPLQVPAVVTRLAPGSPIGVGEVAEHLRDRATVLVGHSGVGKSTLVNALVPGADRATGQVNVVTGRGRHTSTSAVALALPDGGWVIDTPGIRSFGLAHVDPGRLILAFPDLAAETPACPRGCTHADGAPECGLDAALAAGRVDPARLASYRRLLASRDLQAGDWDA